jgi:hypothetical protein
VNALKSAGLVALGAGLAAAGFTVWQLYFSREAEIRAIHGACIKEFADANAKVRSGLGPGATSGTAAGSVASSIGDTVGRWLDGMTGGASDAVCGTIRDACTTDFDGRICTTARERYR